MANQTKLAVILHADVVGSTEMVRQDELHAHEQIQGAFKRFSEFISAHAGVAREVRGDALVAEFERASDAVSTALDFQETNSEQGGPPLRIGIALGEVVIADGTITGEGVILAQRLEQLAEPGGCVVQGAVTEAVPSRLPAIFEFLGEQNLKGFGTPVRAYAAKGSIAERSTDTRTSARETGPAHTQHRVSVAVLPFENLSADSEQAYLAEGITDDLISTLSRYRWFATIPRSSSLAFRTSEFPIPEIARALAVQYVVAGTVRGAGDRLRLSVQLIDAESREQLWSERYDRNVVDIFDVQDEITQRLGAVLGAELSIAEQGRAQRSSPESAETWECYQRGQWHLRKGTPTDSVKAVQWLTRAHELDAEFAPALSVRALAGLQSVINPSGGEREGLIAQAEQDARAAIRLDDTDAYGHYAYASVLSYQQRTEDAIAEFERAAQLNPSFMDIYRSLGMTYYWAGRAEEAIPQFEHALALGPHGFPGRQAVITRGFAQLALQDYDAAISSFRQGIARGSDWHWMYLTLASALAHLGDLGAASEAVTAALEREPRVSLSWVRTALTHQDKHYTEHLIDGLRKAGLQDEGEVG